MSKRAVGLRFVKWVSTDGLELIKVIFTPKSLRHFCVPLSKISGAVSVLTQQIGIQCFNGVRTCQFGCRWRSIGATGQPRKNGRAADPADRVADECVFESRATRCQFVQMGRLHDRVAIASQRAGGLVVGEEENDVRALRRIATTIVRKQEAR